MPPKKAATTAAKTKKVVDGDVKPTKAKTPTTAVKPIARAVTKKTTSPKQPAKKSSKRKAEDDTEAPLTNGVKRTKTKATTPIPDAEQKAKSQSPAQKRKKAAPKAPSSKRTKEKVIINETPEKRLNVYVFGDGSNGELGLGNGKNCLEVKRPRLNPYLDADTVGVVQVSVGGMHTAVLTHDNKILTWGVNDQGALGRDTNWEGGLRDIDDEDSESDSGSESNLNPKESTPSQIDVTHLPTDLIWTQVACTDSATFAVTNDGLVYGCGTFRSNEGIFGFRPDIKTFQSTFMQIPELKKITKLATGANHVLALDNKGAVFAWGSGQQNQLGRRILERFLNNSLIPTQFGLPKSMVNIGAGSYHSFAIRKNGEVYSWGLNSFGETGITQDFDAEGESDVHHPTIITALKGFGFVTEIEGGSHHTAAVTDKGEVLVWGRVDGFQLGIKIFDIPEQNLVRVDGKPKILKVPTQVPGINAVAIAASSDHSLAITKDGKAYAWGFSLNYQTGLGTDEDVEVATMIDNTAVRGKKLVWAGAGGQFSIVAGLAGYEAPMVNGINGHA